MRDRGMAGGGHVQRFQVWLNITCIQQKSRLLNTGIPDGSYTTLTPKVRGLRSNTGAITRSERVLCRVRSLSTWLPLALAQGMGQTRCVANAEFKPESWENYVCVGLGDRPSIGADRPQIPAPHQNLCLRQITSPGEPTSRGSHPHKAHKPEQGQECAGALLHRARSGPP